MEDFYSQLEAAFHTDADVICRKWLHSGPTPEKTMHMVEEIHQLADAFLDQFYAYARNQKNEPECRKGCSWCCYQSVLVNPYEVVYMVYRLYEKNGIHWFKKTIYPAAVKKDERLIGKRIPDFIHKKIACPFLKDGACMAYDFRPLACRTFLSTRAAACESEYRNGEDQTNFAPVYEIPLHIGRRINQAVSENLNAMGVQTTQWRMEWFLRKLVEDPTLFNRWIHGNVDFAERDVDNDEWAYLEDMGIKK